MTRIWLLGSLVVIGALSLTVAAHQAPVPVIRHESRA